MQSDERVATELLRINSDMVKEAVISIKNDVKDISERMNNDLCPRVMLAEIEIRSIKDSVATVVESSAITKTKADKMWAIVQKIVYGMAGVYIFVKILDELRLYSLLAKLMGWR
jgi:hypothetical protein